MNLICGKLECYFGIKYNLLVSRVYSQISSYLAVGLILIGQISFEDRMIVSGVPVNLVLFLLAIFLVLLSMDTIKSSINAIVLISPLFLLFPTLLWTQDIDYGVYKYANLLVTTVLVCSLLSVNTKINGYKNTFKILINVLLLLLVLAVLYKLKNGFFDRNIPFFINGPIVFARLMGLGVVLSLFAFRGWRRFFVVALFLIAVVWTGSKGPLFSLMFVILLYLIWRGHYLVVVSGVVASLVSFFLLSSFVEFHDNSPIKRIADGSSSAFKDEGGGAASTSVRYQLYSESVNYILSDSSGTGLGGWANEIVIGDHNYPHNIFLELLVEGGWLIGVISLIPFMYFFMYTKSYYAFPAFFFFLSQQFSGDLLDARYLLVFSLLSVLTSKKKIIW